MHIQVKTFVPRNWTYSVGLKAEKDFGETFFRVLGGIPPVGTERVFEYYIIRAREMARNVRTAHEQWLVTPGKNDQVHQDSKVHRAHLPPYKSVSGWGIMPYRDRWDLIDALIAP